MTVSERERIARLLEETSEKRSERPTARRLKNEDWPVSYYNVRKNFEEKANLMWRLGFKTDEWKKDDEIVAHELRGLEHNLGRAPLVHEAKEDIKKNIDTADLQNAGIPYRTYTYGPIEPEREDEVIEDLKERLVEMNQSAERLKNSRQYNESEIFMFTDGYLPWTDETGSREFDYDRSLEVIEYLADGFDTLQDVANEYRVQQSELRCVDELKENGLIETRPGIGTHLTRKGRSFYEEELEK